MQQLVYLEGAVLIIIEGAEHFVHSTCYLVLSERLFPHHYTQPATAPLKSLYHCKRPSLLGKHPQTSSCSSAWPAQMNCSAGG